MVVKVLPRWVEVTSAVLGVLAAVCTQLGIFVSHVFWVPGAVLVVVAAYLRIAFRPAKERG